MKIEPIGNAGALEMCSLGLTSTKVAAYSLQFTLRISSLPTSYTWHSPLRASVITTNQFAQHLHKARGEKGKRKRNKPNKE